MLNETRTYRWLPKLRYIVEYQTDLTPQERAVLYLFTRRGGHPYDAPLSMFKIFEKMTIEKNVPRPRVRTRVHTVIGRINYRLKDSGIQIRACDDKEHYVIDASTFR